MRINKKEKPTYDFFEGKDTTSNFELEEILDDFIYSLESGYFSTWEAVVRKEKNKKLNKFQRKQLAQLINFGEEEIEEILYIDEIPRPNKKWYEIALEIANKLFRGRIKAYEIHSSLGMEGWSNLKDSIEEYGEDLSKPKGIKNILDIIPEELQHKLEIQEAIDCLVGLGQEKELGLDNPDQNFRIKELIIDLKEKIVSVEYLKLSIEKIVTEFIELREEDRIKFEEKMIESLGLENINEDISAKLRKHSA